MTEQENKNTNRVVRNFGLTNWAVNNRISVVIIIFLILGMGITAYTTMPKENFPEISIPEIYISVPYPGNSPLDMENLVARPIEKEINTITGLNKVTSNSVQDFTTIVATFDMSEDVDQALLEVKDAVDRAAPELPNDLPTDPNIFKMNFSELPVMNINISGYDNVDILKEYAELLQDEIEKFGEVSGVDIRGVQEKEVTINVDVKRMEALQINFGDVEGAIANENISMSGGSYASGELNRNIRILGEFKDMRSIENVIVKSEDGNIVYLKDIATVKFGFEETSSYARADLAKIVTLDIKKRAGENLIIMAEKIKALIADLNENRFPEKLKVELVNDTSKNTKKMVANLENSIISGVILVVLVLLFFLGLRNALFVGVAIPLSMFLGIALLNMMGVTLNMMVLFSLILALGMLVDNGIVVVENVYRLMDEEGMPAIQAAKEGVGEVAWPIIVSTATTLAAFSPLLFWDDIMGEFFYYMPLTLILVLGSSLFIALVINPVLTAMYMKIDNQQEKTNWLFFVTSIVVCFVLGALARTAEYKILGSLLWILGSILLANKFILTPVSYLFRNYALPFLERIYAWLLKLTLSSIVPVAIVGLTLVLFAVSSGFYFGSNPNFLLFPEGEPNYINIYVEKPIGTDIDITNELVLEIEQELSELLEPYGYMTEMVLAQVGEGTADPNAGAGQSDTPNKARINVTFLEYEKRKGTKTTTLMAMIGEAMEKYPGANITIDKEPQGPPVGKPINIEVSGEDYEELIALVANIKQFLSEFDVPGVEGLKTDLETGKPELILNIDREKARRYGLSTGQIASNIRTAVFGKEVSKLKDGEDDYPIWLRFNEDLRDNIDIVLGQKITFRNNSGRMVQVPVSAVAEREYSSSYGSVKRKDLNRVITLYSNVIPGYAPDKIVNKYKEYLAAYEMPEGFSYKFTGEQEESSKSTEFLSRAFMIAIALIFLILVTQFNSIISPFIIIFTVAMSLIGVFFGYGVAKMDFIILMTGLGIISLAGIVVNNGIVLIDYINLLRQRKRAEYGIEDAVRLGKTDVKETIIEGGKLRLRPVLLTAITTILGLIPLAYGININFTTLLADGDPQFFVGGDNTVFWGPMAFAVIFGLAFATFLTLIVVPVLYYLADRMMYGFSFLRNKLLGTEFNVFEPKLALQTIDGRNVTMKVPAENVQTTTTTAAVKTTTEKVQSDKKSKQSEKIESKEKTKPIEKIKPTGKTKDTSLIKKSERKTPEKKEFFFKRLFSRKKDKE